MPKQAQQSQSAREQSKTWQAARSCATRRGLSQSGEVSRAREVFPRHGADSVKAVRDEAATAAQYVQARKLPRRDQPPLEGIEASHIVERCGGAQRQSLAINICGEARGDCSGGIRDSFFAPA